MAADKNALAEALSASVKDLQQGIDRHCCLVASILRDEVDERNLRPFLEGCPPRSNGNRDDMPLRTRESILKYAIQEAIETLEATRKSFKSKQLESLRKRLTQVLIDAG